MATVSVRCFVNHVNTAIRINSTWQIFVGGFVGPLPIGPLPTRWLGG